MHGPMFLILLLTFYEKEASVPVSQPPYSPDLASCNFWLFLLVKKELKGLNFFVNCRALESRGSDLKTTIS